MYTAVFHNMRNVKKMLNNFECPSYKMQSRFHQTTNMWPSMNTKLPSSPFLFLLAILAASSYSFCLSINIQTPSYHPVYIANYSLIDPIESMYNLVRIRSVQATHTNTSTYHQKHCLLVED